MTKDNALLVTKMALRMYLIQKDSKIPNVNEWIEETIDKIIAALTKESLKTSGLDQKVDEMDKSDKVS